MSGAEKAGAVLLALLVGALVHASRGINPERVAPTALIVTGRARATTGGDWSPALYQPERAYCGAWEMRHDTLAVTRVEAPDSLRDVSWDTIAFSCAPKLIPIHTHPAQSCNATETYCAVVARPVCAPSESDQRMLLVEHEAREIVQCGPETFALYGPATIRGSVAP